MYRLQQKLRYSYECRIVMCFGKIVKVVDYVSHIGVSYVCPQAVTRLPQDGCSSNLIISPESFETVQVSFKIRKE